MKRIFIIISAFVLLAVAGYAGWQIYQNHLSSDLKRTLIAACAPDATEADVHVYIRDARLQVHTKKDGAILGKLVTIVQLEEDSSETSNRIMRETMQSLQELATREDPVSKLIAIEDKYREMHLAIPADLKKEIDNTIAEEKEERRRNEEDSKRADDEQATAMKLYAELRSDLGLSPLKGN